LTLLLLLLLREERVQLIFLIHIYFWPIGSLLLLLLLKSRARSVYININQQHTERTGDGRWGHLCCFFLRERERVWARESPDFQLFAIRWVFVAFLVASLKTKTEMNAFIEWHYFLLHVNDHLSASWSLLFVEKKIKKVLFDQFLINVRRFESLVFKHSCFCYVIYFWIKNFATKLNFFIFLF